MTRSRNRRINKSIKKNNEKTAACSITKCITSNPTGGGGGCGGCGGGASVSFVIARAPPATASNTSTGTSTSTGASTTGTTSSNANRPSTGSNKSQTLPVKKKKKSSVKAPKPGTLSNSISNSIDNNNMNQTTGDQKKKKKKKKSKTVENNETKDFLISASSYSSDLTTKKKKKKSPKFHFNWPASFGVYSSFSLPTPHQVPWMFQAKHQAPSSSSSPTTTTTKTFASSSSSFVLPTHGIPEFLLQRLDGELSQIETLVKLTPLEVQARQCVTQRLQEAITTTTTTQQHQRFQSPFQSHTCQPQAQVRVFGSFATLPICCYTSDIDVAITGVVPVPVLPLSPRTPLSIRDDHHEEEEEDEADQHQDSYHGGASDQAEQDKQTKKEKRKQERMRRWLLALDEVDRANETAQGISTIMTPPPSPPPTTEGTDTAVAIDIDGQQQQGQEACDQKTESSDPATHSADATNNNNNNKQPALNNGGQIEEEEESSDSITTLSKAQLAQKGDQTEDSHNDCTTTRIVYTTTTTTTSTMTETTRVPAATNNPLKNTQGTVSNPITLSSDDDDDDDDLATSHDLAVLTKTMGTVSNPITLSSDDDNDEVASSRTASSTDPDKGNEDDERSCSSSSNNNISSNSDQDSADKLAPLQRRKGKPKDHGPCSSSSSFALASSSVSLSQSTILARKRGWSLTEDEQDHDDMEDEDEAVHTMTTAAVLQGSTAFSSQSSDTEEDESDSADYKMLHIRKNSRDNNEDAGVMKVSMTARGSSRKQLQKQQWQLHQLTKASRDNCLNALKKLRNKVSKRFRMACQLIQARVPILKLELPAFQVDIAIDGCNGADTSGYATEQVKKFQSFAPVVLFLKVLLAQQDLDTPFTGGLGSYKLYVLVAYHIQRHLEHGGNDRPGEILLSLLLRYGRVKHSYTGNVVSNVFHTHLSVSSNLQCHGGSADLSNVFQLPKCLELFEACWDRIRTRLQTVERESKARHGRDHKLGSVSLLNHVLDGPKLFRDRQQHMQKSQMTLEEYQIKATTPPPAVVGVASSRGSGSGSGNNKRPRNSSAPSSSSPASNPFSFPVDRTAEQLVAGYSNVVAHEFLSQEQEHHHNSSNQNHQGNVWNKKWRFDNNNNNNVGEDYDDDDKTPRRSNKRARHWRA